MAREDIVLTAGLDVKEFNRGIQSFVNGLNQMEKQSQQVSSSINRLGDSASTGLGVAMGVAAVNAIQSATGAMVGFGKEILNTLKFFESLQFSLETTIALNTRAAESGLSMSDALEQSADAAQSYLLELQDIAIFSPFTTKEIGSANRTLQIYGLLQDEALGLTKLITDLASVGGFGAERLQRISLATGQIFAEGRLLARDALQLTQAGVPILRFIENMTGKTTGEIQKMMRKGLLPASLAFEALVDGLKDFEGSGRRVAGTAQGLFSSLEDIQQITGRDLFKGIFEGVRPFLQSLVDFTSADEFRAQITAIGEDLGGYVNQGIQAAANAVERLFKTFRGLPPEVFQFAAIFVTVGAGLAAFGSSLGLLQLAVTALINPFTVVIGLIAGFVTLLIAGQLRIAQGAKDMTTAVNDSVIRMANSFKTFANIPDGIAREAAKMADAFGRAGEFIIRTFESIARAAGYATDYISDLLEQVFDWGASVGELFGAGIANAVGFVTQSLGVIGSAITGLLQPGSPPKLLPEIDEWGKKTAEEWLKGWTTADFDILSDITSSIRSTLRALAQDKKISDLSAVQILIGSRQDIANAVNEINSIGTVTDETMRRVRNSVGPASDEVEALLKAYEDVTKATWAAEGAQLQLDNITKQYEKTLDPIRKELERISELRRQGDEEAEIRSLQRTIANEAVGSSRKRQAQLRIEEILLGRQVKSIEDQRDADIERAESFKDSADLELEKAEEGLKLAQARIDAQNEQLALYGEEERALEALAKELAKLAKELREQFLKPFEDAIKRMQLLQQEVRDTISLFKQNYILQSDTASEAAKVSAEIEKQAIAARRAKREIELSELGVSDDEIDRLRNFAVTLSDIGVKTGDDGLRDFVAPDLSEIAEDVTDRITEFRERVDAFKVTMAEAREEFNKWLLSINAVLPPSLKFIKIGEEQADLFRNLRAAFAAFAAIIISNRFVSVLRSLPGILLGVGTPLGLLANLLGVFAFAWMRNFGDIRTTTKNSIDFVRGRIQSFVDEGGFSSLLPSEGEFQSALDAIEDRWRGFAEYISGTLEEGISVQEFQEALGRLEEVFRSTANSLFQIEVFAGIRDQVLELYNTITDPSAMADAFNTFVMNLRENIQAAFNQLITGDTDSEQSLVEYIGRNMVAAAAAFIYNIPVWIANFINAIDTFLNQVRPTLDVLFEDFFSTIVPALLFLLGRSVGTIGSALARLTLTALDIFFTQLVPAFVRALPRMLGALAFGFAKGVEEVGNSVQDTLIIFVGSITGFIAAFFGPQILSAFSASFGRAFGIVGRQIFRDLNRIRRGLTAGLQSIGIVAARILVAITRDIASLFSGILGSVGSTFARIGSVVTRALGTGAVRALRSLTTVISRGLTVAVVSLGKAMQPLSFWGDTAIPAIGRGLRSIIGIVGSVSGAFFNLNFRLFEFIRGLSLFGAGTVVSGFRAIETAIAGLFAAFAPLVQILIKTRGGLLAIGYALLYLPIPFGMVALLVKDLGVFIYNAFAVQATRGIGVFTKAFGRITALFDEFNDLRRSTGIMNAIPDMLSRPLYALGRAVNSIGRGGFNAITSLFTNIGKAARTGLAQAIPSLRSFGDEAIKLSLRPLSALKSFGPTVARSLDEAGAAVRRFGSAGKIQTGVGRALSGIGSVARGGLSGLQNLVLGAPGKAGRAGGLLGSLRNLNVTSAVTSLKNLGGVLKGLRSILMGFLSPLALITSAIDFFAFSFTHEIEGVENGARGLVDGIRGLWSDLIDGSLFRNIVTTARNWFGQLSELFSLISEFGFDSDEVRGKLDELRTSITNWIQDAAGRIWESLRTFWIPTFFAWIGETVSNTVNMLGAIAAAIVNWIGMAAGWFGSKVTDEWIPAFTNWWTEGGGREKTGERLSSMLEQIGTWIVNAVEFIAGKLKIWIPAFLGWIVEVGPKVLAGLVGLLVAIGKWIIDNGPTIANKLLEWGTAFISWLAEVTPKALAKLGEWLGALVSWIISDGIPGIIKGTIGLIGALVGWIAGGGEGSAENEAPNRLLQFLGAITNFIFLTLIPAIWKVGWEIAKGVWDGFSELWDDFTNSELGIKLLSAVDRVKETTESWIEAGQDLGRNLINGIVDWIKERISDVLGAIFTVAEALGVEEEVARFLQAGIELGQSIMTGIGDGIKQLASWPVEKLREALNNLRLRGQEEIEAGSPSKLFARDIGVPIAEGIGVGIASVDQKKNVEKLSDNLVGELSTVTEESKKELNSLSTNATAVLTRLRKEAGNLSAGLKEDVFAEFNELRDSTTDLLTELEEFLGELFNRTSIEMVSDVGTLRDDVYAEFVELEQDVSAKMDSLRADVIDEFITMRTGAVNEAILMSNEIIGVLVSNDDSMINQLYNALLGPDGQNGPTQGLGLDFIAGIAMGASSQESKDLLYNAIVETIDWAIEAVRIHYDMNSPSEVAARLIGEPLIEGIIAGMVRTMPAITKLIDEITIRERQRIEGISRTFDSAPSTFAPTNVTTNSTRNYNLTVNSAATSQGIIRDFATIQALE